jgi:hypothetical protein
MAPGGDRTGESVWLPALRAGLLALRAGALAAVFVAGFLLVSSVVVVRGRVLDPDLYTGALVRADAYERTYTEVLADPELAELTERLLGGVRAERLEPVQVRAAATGALRLVLPPETLRRSTEAVVAAVLAYVRGDVPRLDPDVDVTGVLDRIDEAGAAWVRSVVGTAPERVAATLAEYRDAVAEAADQLAAGTVPAAVPVLADRAGAAGVDPGAVATAVLDRLGPDVDARVREQVEAAALAGDERSALVAAAGELVAARAAEVRDDLRAALEDGRDLDVVTEAADRAERSRAAVVGRLDGVRDAARWFGVPTAVAGGLLMAGSVAGLVWSERRRPRRAGLLVAGVFLAGGVALLVVWTAVTGLVGAPLEPATGTGDGSWGLPVGLQALLADVEGALGDELARTVRWLVLTPVAAGALLAAGVVLGPRVRAWVAARPGRSGARSGPVPRPRPAVALAAVAALVAVWLVPTRAASGAAPEACNGHAELCDRRYDEVTYAATHNSMSSPDVVSIWPEHDGDIRAQLDAGVRALLIDTHHWTPLVDREQLTEVAAGTDDRALPAELAGRVFDRIGPQREPRDGAFLCHNQCDLGALPLHDALVTVREFLQGNPAEVVTLIVQDAIPADETAAEVRRAGLAPYLHTHAGGEPWATLGELVERGERLVVFAEDQGPPPDWYHHAFDHIQDTPYRFEEPGDLSCEPNRGEPDAPLFLLNHWVQRIVPDRATAAAVNRHDVIVDRANRCERERGLRTTFVAVDFYGVGDLLAAVDTLNGVG